MGSLVQASMIGLHGVYVPRWVNIPSVTAITETINIAMGRRAQWRSPWAAKSGSMSKPAIIRIGTVNITGVSIDVGRNARTA
jgi:hypothetical protein